MTSPYLGCQTAHEIDFDRIVYPVGVEDKIDGLRSTHADGDGYTKRGNTYETWRPFSQIFASILPTGTHVDTEIAARSWNETSSLFKRMKDIDHAAIRAHGTAFVFDVFDQASIGVEPLLERRKAVEWLVAEANHRHPEYNVVAVPLTIVHNRAELDEAMVDARRRGREGLMVKALNGLYRLKKSWDWMKFKEWKDVTVVIAGLNHGWESCPACMPIEARRRRAIQINLQGGVKGKTVTEKDVKPDKTCLVCLGATDGLPRYDLLGSFSCVDSNGNAWDVGMGFTDVQKLDFMKRGQSMIGVHIDVQVQDDGPLPETPNGSVPPVRNDIVARHAVFMRERAD